MSELDDALAQIKREINVDIIDLYDRQERYKTNLTLIQYLIAALEAYQAHQIDEIQNDYSIICTCWDEGDEGWYEGNPYISAAELWQEHQQAMIVQALDGDSA